MTTHLTRAIPRPLRQGDRVRDRFAVSGYHAHNYPGANRFGTVIQGPRTFPGQSCPSVEVRFDDHYTGWMFVTDLDRL